MKEKVIQLIADEMKIEPSKVTMESIFVDDLNCDSLDLVELIMKIEDEFDIEIPEEEARGLKAVSDVVNYLEKHKP